MLPGYRRNDRSPLVKHIDSLGSQSLISRLTEGQATRNGQGYDDDAHDSSFEIVGTMRVDTRRLLNQPFSTIINFSKPMRLGYYSISFDSARKMDFTQDASALRYLCCPKSGRVNIDLLYGFNGTSGEGGRGGGRGSNRPADGSPKTMHFLEWIAANKNDLMSDTEKSEPDIGIGDEGASNETTATTKDTFADFICDSSLLKTIMSTPYISSEDSWTIVAVKIKGIIYLTECPTVQPMGNSAPGFVNNNASRSYAGLKFKEMISVRSNGIHSQVNSMGNRDSFWMVCKTNVGCHHRVMYNSRTDCALDNQQLVKTINEAVFVEIRTRPSSITERQWERRAIAWWLTSILSGSKMIFCGERDQDFFVRKVTKIYVDSIPKQRYKWSPKACVDFLDETLTFIKSMVHDEMKPYRFVNLVDQVICSTINEPVEKFISTWYIESSMYEADAIVSHQPSEKDNAEEEEEEEDSDGDANASASCIQSDQETQISSDTEINPETQIKSETDPD